MNISATILSGVGVAISGGILIVFPYLPVEFFIAVAISVGYGLILSPYQVKNKLRHIIEISSAKGPKHNDLADPALCIHRLMASVQPGIKW